MSTSSASCILAFCLFVSVFVAQALVPANNTFRYVNEGEFGEYSVEYGANYRVTSLFTFPFTLCFYNTTPNAFTLGLRMGIRQSESIMRWVWDANRGKPVKEGAILTFGTEGNLVLADSNGKIAWQTATSNKGVVGLSLLPNGNLVLYDAGGKFVWQSFNYPTDTLLAGQSLTRNGPSKLVSRVSAEDGSNGAYTLELERNTLALYLKSKNSPKPILYYRYEDFGSTETALSSIVFSSSPEYDERYAYVLAYDLYVGNSSIASHYVGRPNYNSTLSMLRVEFDGSLRAYTYYDKVDWGAWEITYSLFDKDGVYGESECKLPTRCGSLGVCEDSQCVACPTPKGLLGWSKTCVPPTLPSCSSGSSSIKYYKVVGVDHFMNEYNEGEGPMKVSECRGKCNKDCGCLGFLYNEVSSKCVLAPELGTFTKVSNASHVAYIKIAK